MTNKKTVSLSPKKSPTKSTLPEHGGEKFKYGEILEKLADQPGLKATKIEWGSPDHYLTIDGESLRYYSGDGVPHIFDTRIPDILGDDWIII